MFFRVIERKGIVEDRFSMCMEFFSLWEIEVFGE